MCGLKISRIPEFNLKNNQGLRLCSFYSRCMKTGCKQKKYYLHLIFSGIYVLKQNLTFSGSEFVNVTDIFEISFDYDREICQPWVFFKKIKKAHLRIILKFYFDKLLNEQ